MSNKTFNRKAKAFNIILTGVGGQGIITLLSIIDEAALIEGNEIRSSELHGLSQRGGSVEAHIRFGKNVYSPLVSFSKADLIIGLEKMEGLRRVSYANNETKFLINDYLVPFIGILSNDEITKKLKDVASDNLHLIPASNICQKELEKEVVSGIYLLGYAVYKDLLPIKPESVLKAIEKIIPQKYLELNKKAFALAKN
jgi:indolepyruvate ferredoxin oxidoreductase beta subunit